MAESLMRSCCLFLLLESNIAKEMRVEPCVAARRGSLSAAVGDDVGGGCSCGLQGAHVVLCRFSALVSWLELLIDFGSAIYFFQNVPENSNMMVEWIHFRVLAILFFYGLLR